ncbi:MAG: HAD family hydrolase [Clostridia bacterium]|nr:HAD family hydrolase [Clostridia bacterium]
MLIQDKKVFFFDMGNTLLDFHQVLSDEEKDQLGLKSLQKALENEGVLVSQNTLEQDFLIPIHLYHKIRIETLMEVDVLPLLRQYKDFDDATCIELLKAFYQPYKEHIQVNLHAKEILAYLKAHDKKIIIVSNCYLPGVLYKDIFKSVGLSEFIDGYVFSYDITYRKPRIEIFKKALALAERKPSECVMIGDGLKPDIFGASQLQIESIWYNPNHKKKNTSYETCLYEIDDFNALKKL